ncbi:MAG: MiaB-like tRNA modifying enzyme [Thermotoga sp. 50_1627]|uniref:tRNA (N(6)-L-threonylcarbamoyladenosine(37)-C(2))- methylthiotransferase MtaB n=1 Tax=Pseudothermotoga sp. TaxID=2033661 RepID=UPI00076D0EFE|nr:MAG: MiaB-like tRNA modifying enzyme [Thermotoga sp. 50_64]KUK25268.1 MAG: MiaB-like tRNA modifying enzyme [Thermotoga sp. 50_1627]MBC7116300.1 tRNA (N(6)-L-threonylcarbamoyladenosine(37)-C(2))-methylthiotransferase MtaB [Pseudothermotoga sp.]MDK2922703.1 threonylcarbamoyladenosine tRNA methylthiotransferase MtaB [Pseudothermotoga sp.]HBT38677.1 tRNA (N(6)-L-threonylcarbamoyladenosine(37)-C(2))-methylthiotransferase MtaB [Pseudothermotoga sp.]
MRAFVTFLGCKVNQYETELIIEQLEHAGIVVSSQPVNVDICIVNTCMVTNEAARQSRQLLRKLRRMNPDGLVIATGCYPHLDALAIKGCGVDLVLGNREKKELIKHINEWFQNREQKVMISQPDYEISEQVNSFLADRVRAYVKVQDGCDEYCTYCIVPLARGRKIRSKPAEVVIQEVRNLVDSGYKEIVLTGVNLGRYGRDTDTSLARLVRRLLNEVVGDFRIRLSSINVQDISGELIELFKNNEKLCPHLHVPIQSGSNKILKAMNRSYTVEQALALFERLRSIDPFFSITTDIIVGFPEETIGDFEETLALVEEVMFSRVHAFKYSDRPNTPASRMSHKVPPGEKDRRMKLLREIAEKVAVDYRTASVGKIRTVLVEMNKDGVSYGYDQYYIRHEFVSLSTNVLTRVVVKKPNGAGVVSQVVDLEKSLAG